MAMPYGSTDSISVEPLVVNVCQYLQKHRSLRSPDVYKRGGFDVSPITERVHPSLPVYGADCS
jgi:hypothetical protein